MNQVIIYKQDNGVLAVIRPTESALENYTMMEIALKDVPSGKPFKIVDADIIPTDRSLRAAWTCDDTDLTDGVGADRNTFE